jgi:hypothetical protein
MYPSLFLSTKECDNDNDDNDDEDDANDLSQIFDRSANIFLFPSSSFSSCRFV